MAVVANGTEVIIVARHRVEFVDTAIDGMAPVGGTDIAVVAVQQLAPMAGALAALVVGGANAAIVAGLLVDQGNATFCWVAGVGCTGVTVFAIKFFPGHTAEDRMTALEAVAGVVVRWALQWRSGHATQFGVADFNAIAGIVVIAAQWIATEALAIYAEIAGGACVAIDAWGFVVIVEAAKLTVAAIIGAEVVVMADALEPSGAHTGDACIGNGASITIFAWKAFVCRDYGAGTACGVTGARKADCIGSLRRLSTDRDGAGVDLALVGPLLQVADERSIAEVAIFQSVTVIIALAIAGDGKSAASAVGAGIGDGAGVAVIASCGVLFEEAASTAITGVVGALVVVVADHGIADTKPGLAVVGDGAGVAVLAFAGIEVNVIAPGLALAVVLSAIVAVIAKIDVVAFVLFWFVHIFVTVIVDTVARFDCWHGRIAGGQAIFGADPLTHTESEFVGGGAWCPEGESY